MKSNLKSKGVDEHVGPTSLKSVRGSIKDGGDLKPPIELKKPDPPQVTVWKCPDCGYLNSIEQQECGNTKKCKANVGYIDVPEFMEVGLAELEKAQANFANPAKEPEEEAMAADEWICEHCQGKNKMTDDAKSAICVKCRKKNEIVEYMISAKADEAARKAEGEYLEHF